VQVTLPHRNPGDVPAWSRSNGSLTMTVRPGWDHEKQKTLGYPYGSIPRLLLFWLTAEAVRTAVALSARPSAISWFTRVKPGQVAGHEATPGAYQAVRFPKS
jgi:hypothetical protein